MSASIPLLRTRVLVSALVFSGAVLLGTCTDGSNPAGLTGETRLSLTLGEGSLADLAPDEVRPIEQIRVTAVKVPDGGVLGSTTVEVDPGAGQWTLEVSFPLPVESTVVVTLSVELISLTTGSELVEWSGRSGSITLRVGTPTDVGSIVLVKGPLANLSVTGITIQTPLDLLLVGENTQLSATVSTTTPQSPPTIFWRSLNPAVASVSGNGLVVGVAPGQARIVATAGAVADTVTIRVAPRPTSVILEPAAAVLEALGEEVTFRATVLDGSGQPIPGAGVTWRVGDAGILRPLGSGAFRSESRGTTLVTATSTLVAGVSGSAEVVVRQAVAAVQMVPEEGMVFIGQSLPFQAVALDPNGHPVEGMGFSWSTSDPSVASVDGNGLARGLGSGTTTVLAAAVSDIAGIGTEEGLAPTPGTIGMANLDVRPLVASVVISPTPHRFRSLGETLTFTAQALDAAGNPIPGLPYSWASSNESVVSVDQTGLATGLATGTAVLEATAGGVTGLASVVVDQAVYSVTITPDPWSFVCPEGCESRVFTGWAFDALGGRIFGVEFTWEVSDGECSSVSNPGNGGAAAEATVESHCSCWNGQLDATADGVTGTASIGANYCEAPAPAWLDPGPGDPVRASPFLLGVSRLPVR